MARRDHEAVMADAAALFARRQSGAAQAAEVDAWLDAGPANAAAYARLEAAWERADRLKALSLEEAPQSDALRRPFLPTRRMAAGLALAAIGGAAGVGWLVSGRQVHATGLGERRTLTLADGSTIELNTDSRVEVAYTAARRRIVLRKGEALFDVAKDAARPFTVAANGAEVRAVGTAFNIRLRDRMVELTVTEGVVAVDDGEGRAAAGDASGKAEPRRVSQGAGAMIASGAVAEVALDPEVMRRRLLWRDGFIEFEGDTLDQAVEEFNRYNDRKLVIADPQVAGIRVGGRFGTHEVDRFLGALQAGFPVRTVSGDEDRIYLVHAS